MLFKKKGNGAGINGMVPEEKGMVWRHAKTGWGKHLSSSPATTFTKVDNEIISMASLSLPLIQGPKGSSAKSGFRLCPS